MTFRWKDYATAGQPAIMTLQATEFIRRFLLHVLPRGFVKIRHFGFLANRCRQERFQLCRKLLENASTTTAVKPRAATRFRSKRKPSHLIAVRSVNLDA